MDPETLESLFDQLRAFGDGTTDRAALRRWFLPFHTAPIPIRSNDDHDVEVDSSDSWSLHQLNKALFWHLVYLFEGESTEERHRDLARRVAACYIELADASAVLA